jgi:hypothetical protein
LLDSNRTRTVQNYSSTDWLSQWANKAPKNTEGHKAKKARKTQEISGLPDNERSFDISTKVRNSLKSPSTNGRSLSCSSSSSSSDDTRCGGDKPQERAQLRNEDNIAELMKKRRLEVEEYSFDSLMRSLATIADVTLFMLTQEWLQNEWHHIIRRWRRIYEVLYIQRKS